MGQYQNLFSNQYPLTNATDRGLCFYDGNTSSQANPQIKTCPNLLYNSDGTITDTTRPIFKVYYNANTAANIAGGSDYILMPNAKAFDDTNSFNLGTGTFLPTTAGRHLFHIMARAFSISLSIGAARAQSYALSSTEVGVAEDRAFNALISLNSSYVSVGNTTIMNLAVNQPVQFHLIISNILGVYGVSGGTLTSLNTTVISGWRL